MVVFGLLSWCDIVWVMSENLVCIVCLFDQGWLLEVGELVNLMVVDFDVIWMVIGVDLVSWLVNMLFELMSLFVIVIVILLCGKVIVCDGKIWV